MGKEDITTVKGRLITFLDSQNISKIDFGRKIDVSSAYVTSIRKSIQPDKIDKIKKNFQQLNMEWLLTGEGQMMQEPSQHETQADDADKGNMVRLVPISAMGGSLAEFASSAMYFDCEQVVSPVKGADFIISVTGESMAPEYPSGSKVIIKKINERAFIDWGRTYVLDTCNGAVIKKIMPGSTPDCVRCVSINPDYPDFEVAFADMYDMYRVLMMMCEK